MADMFFWELDPVYAVPLYSAQHSGNGSYDLGNVSTETKWKLMKVSYVVDITI
jgi:hypothetical protein